MQFSFSLQKHKMREMHIFVYMLLSFTVAAREGGIRQQDEMPLP